MILTPRGWRFVIMAAGGSLAPWPAWAGVPASGNTAAGAGPVVAVVRQWDRFEIGLSNASRYADPYNDVELAVRFTRPDGSRGAFWGFYDGGTTWRARLIASQPGAWSYEAAFSDGSPGCAGRFDCRPSHLPGLVAPDAANPMWFGYSSGQHFLMRALHVGDRFFAANWPADKRQAFLDWAVAQRYNTLSIASHFLNRDAPGRGRGWDTPRLWPLDAGEYQRMEAILDELARRGINVFPFAGFFGQSSNYPRDRRQQERYVRYTLARLAAYTNVLWNVAGPEPNVGKGWMDRGEVERLGRMIGALDPYRHLLSVHNRTGDDLYRDADWTTYGVLQGPKTLDLDKLSRGLLHNHHPSKPLMAQETLWSGNKNHIRANQRDYSDDELRQNAFVIQMSAAALVFADNDGDSSTGFSGTLERADCRQDRHDIIRRVWDFMETVPYYRMSPRQDLVDRGYCLAAPGSEYLVYLPTGGSVAVRREGGPYQARWINARRPAEVCPAPTDDGVSAFAAPGPGDWLLHLTRPHRPG